MPKKKAEPKKMGRPEVIIDEKALIAACSYKIPLDDCAVICGCSVDSLKRYIRKNYDLTFAQFRDKYTATTRAKLITKAIKMALTDGNTAMMIFCLKNLCGWADKQEINNAEGKEFTLSYSVGKNKTKCKLTPKDK